MSTLPKVIITDYINEPLDCERRVLNGYAAISSLNIRSQAGLDGRIEDADAIMIYHFLTLEREHMERMKKCRIIVRPGVGYDNIDIAAARELGIPVCNVPDYGTEEVADSAIGMALTLARGIHFLNSRLRRGEGVWSVEQAAPVHRLRGRVLGIVGCGRIGSAMAIRAKACGLDVVFHDPFIPDGVEKALGVRRTDSLDALLAQSHIVSLHCPLTPSTRMLIGARELARMPKGSFFINTARGGVADTAAVVDALASGHLSGAGIDVLEQEPPPGDSPVLRAWRDPSHPAHDRLLLNPHAAFYCEEGSEEFRTKAAREILRALHGEPLRNRVN
ncbi:MAG TPA: C-terminal binding protein [Roseimicrobium sp.]|nr:C-terminal binding protein [Roseimicrobium sp.]